MENSRPEISAALVLLGEEHSGRDEMNLAGHPFALLQAASKTEQRVLRHSWQRTLANGKSVTASWEVSGHPEMGLPGPNEEMLYLILLQISREVRDESGEWPQTLQFSRHNLLERLGWSGNAREYKLLQDCFFRLQAVTIQTIYAFYDPRTGAPLPAIAFNLIDSFAFAEERTGPKNKNSPLPLSWFKWSDVLHASFVAGNVRSLALDFALSIDLPICRRLFRILELLRHSRKPPLAEVRLEMFDLRDRLGMTAYAYPSKVKEKIAPAVKDLVERGYLGSVHFEKAAAREETVVFTFATVGRIGVEAEQDPSAALASSAPPLFDLGDANFFAPNQNPDSSLFDADEETDDADIRADAAAYCAIFRGLPDAEQETLRQQARAEVAPAFWDRLEVPESPMSLRLWELVKRDYGDKIQR